ncbi:uncharacterized protein J4E92_009827 [Alternaria infectoria]|uniref:uncharacterized protein n=1 Tax=Alternaria infectoria TaxID=45303 RepID=UPI00221FA8F2|nr:uncharacterized protein J4E92_009827 [Alternaria infectoria]KAI4913204.1 hypothetical protein J4E92_009827 [Alternaria infectoria]
MRHLEDFLQVKRKKLDIDGLFRRQSIAGGVSLKKYLDTTFARDYKKEFHKKAFADPSIEYKWCVITVETRSLGKDLTVEQYEQAVKERDTFRDWIRTMILPQPSDGHSLDKILIFPSGDTEPMYRHEYPK